MDSWTLQGDSYSFLRSAPRSFSLCHRDGTPNHIEIFDIINVPTQRSAISETTCLCDIFGDDCESPSLSSTPTSGPAHSHREVDGRAAASPLVDELNDSSGSYHTPQGSSEGEEITLTCTTPVTARLPMSPSPLLRKAQLESMLPGLPTLTSGALLQSWTTMNSHSSNLLHTTQMAWIHQGAMRWAALSKAEARDEKLLKLSPLPHHAGKPLSRSQPMQIECKAVCWKEDKNKLTPCKLDPERRGENPQVSPQLIDDTRREQKNSQNTQNYATGDAAVSKPHQPDPREEAETRETTAEAADNEDEHVVLRRDRKPPMLGSLPKLPSKEREVSTAIVVIRDGSSRTIAPASPAQEDIQAQATSPSPGPITPASTPGSSSHSVSMLLKEKGYQADIGAMVSDVQSATAGGKCVPHKHVNCLEIPLQTATPSDGGHAESQRERTFSSSSTTSGSTAVCNKTDTQTKTRGGEVSFEPAVKDAAKQKSDSPPRNTHQQTSPLAKRKELTSTGKNNSYSHDSLKPANSSIRDRGV
ncbi:uncharacterized protein LOC143010427 [Genypterus blacodes]|uniref:uncharacterized protein LOC143010427 n=1 Tax=Genypterus blacodes TaxID=154954 RepID=UPI003F757E90